MATKGVLRCGFSNEVMRVDQIGGILLTFVLGNPIVADK